MNMNAPERDCRRGVSKTTAVADIWKVRHHDHNARAFKDGGRGAEYPYSVKIESFDSARC
jgi:hypothetical protein